MFIDVDGIPVRLPRAAENYSEEAMEYVHRKVRRLKEDHPNLLHVAVIRLEGANNPNKRRLIWGWSTL